MRRALLLFSTMALVVLLAAGVALVQNVATVASQTKRRKDCRLAGIRTFRITGRV
jgi:type II secretory pathway component PulF